MSQETKTNEETKTVDVKLETEGDTKAISLQELSNKSF